MSKEVKGAYKVELEGTDEVVRTETGTGSDCSGKRIKLSDVSPLERLTYSTVRVHNAGEVGTGFFVKFGKVTFLVTNHHVIFRKDTPEGNFALLFRASVGTAAELLFVQIRTNHLIRRLFVPCEGLDLCFMNFDRFTEILRLNRKITPKICPLSILEPTPFVEASIDLWTEVMMIGYPSGYWDDVNNYPIYRRGSFASIPDVNFKGHPEFLIDIPMFEGSYGSPVFCIKAKFLTPDIYFIGVVHAGPRLNKNETLDTGQADGSNAGKDLNVEEETATWREPIRHSNLARVIRSTAFMDDLRTRGISRMRGIPDGYWIDLKVEYKEGGTVESLKNVSYSTVQFGTTKLH